MRRRTLSSRLKNTCTTVVAIAMFAASVPVALGATDPIAHFRFDDGSGTSPDDSSSNNITAAFMTPNPTWTTTVAPVSFSNPYALKFEGTGDGVQVTWPAGLNFTGTEPRTFSFWYRPTMDGESASGNFDRIMSWSSDAFEIAGTYGDVAVHRLAFYDGSWRDTGYDMTVNTWYNIAFTYDGTNVKLYVSGDQKYSGTSAGRDLSGTMYIGVRSTGDEGINGIIDDFRVYDYALTSTQVSNIVSGSDNPDVAASSSASSSAAGGGANMPVWLLNLRQQNNLTPYGTIASASSSSSASQASSSSSASSLSMQSSSASSLASSATSSSASSHSAAPALSVNPFQQRICSRVLRWFVTETSALSRLNSRLLKRFGFECR